MIVEAKHTAIGMGSGDLSVLATPAMVALMEGAAMAIGARMCDAGQTTVGVRVDIEHTRATPLGAEVHAEARLVSQDGRALTFEVTAFDERGQIGHGTHERFIVDREKFMSRLGSSPVNE